MQSQQQQIIAKCKEMYAKAVKLYGIDLSNTRVSFDLKGRSAGQAGRRNGMLYMRFNNDMLSREAFDHVLNETVPHEVAHLICFMNPMIGRNHNPGWRRVFISLGGSGARTHKEEVVYGKGMTFEYTTTTGGKYRLSERKHKQVQSGDVLRFRSTSKLGQIDKSCTYTIVGVAGRTLAAPVIPKQQAITPAVRTAPVQRLVDSRPVQQQVVHVKPAVVRDFTVQQVIAEATKRLGRNPPLEYLVDAMDEMTLDAAAEVLVLDAKYQK